MESHGASSFGIHAIQLHSFPLDDILRNLELQNENWKHLFGCLWTLVFVTGFAILGWRYHGL
jgi:hypothetical protein